MPPEAFPFIVDALNGNGEVVWSVTVATAGGLHVPALAHTYGPVSIRITYPDGTVQQMP